MILFSMSYPFGLFAHYLFHCIGRNRYFRQQVVHLFQTVHYSQQRKKVAHVDIIGFPVLELSQSDKAYAGSIGSLFLSELVS